MISIVTKFDSAGKREIVDMGAHELTDVDTAGSYAAELEPRTANAKLIIRLWCRQGNDPNGFYIAIHQDHFQQLRECIDFADKFGYTEIKRGRVEVEDIRGNGARVQFPAIDDPNRRFEYEMAVITTINNLLQSDIKMFASYALEKKADGSILHLYCRKDADYFKLAHFITNCMISLKTT